MWLSFYGVRGASRYVDELVPIGGTMGVAERAEYVRPEQSGPISLKR